MHEARATPPTIWARGISDDRFSIRCAVAEPAAEPSEQDLRQIAASAQVAWFSLIGFLAFYMLVILSTRDADFLIDTKRTQLPLVNISISTTMFYLAAPIVTVALYAYLHFLCFILWNQARRVRNLETLSSALSASLIGTVILTLKRDTHPRGLDDVPWLVGFSGAVCAGLLLFGLQPAVLLLSFAASDAATDVPVWAGATVRNVTGASFAVSVLIGAASLTAALSIREGRTAGVGGTVRWILRWAIPVVFVGSALATGVHAWNRPVAIDVRQAILPDLPGGVSVAAERRETYRQEWCKASGLPLDVCAPRVVGILAWIDLERERRDYCTTTLRTRTDTLCRSRFAVSDGAFAADWERVRRGELAGVPRVDLSKRSLDRLLAEGTQLPHAILNDAVLPKAKLDGANLESADLIGADLREITGQYATFDRANLTRADLRGASLPTASLEQAKLPGSNLVGADLRNAGFEGADLTGAYDPKAGEWQRTDLTLANLSEARLQRADLAGARLDGAILNGANLADATGLQQRQLADAVGDAQTVLPVAPFPAAPLTIQSCWVSLPVGIDAAVRELSEAARKAALERAGAYLCKGRTRIVYAAVPDSRAPAPDLGAIARQVDVAQAKVSEAVWRASEARRERELATIRNRLADNRARLDDIAMKVSGGAPAARPGGCFDTSASRFLGQVRFGPGPTSLSPDASAQLRRLAETIARTPFAQVCILGYTDRQGSPEANLAIARKRADTVRAILLRSGASRAPIVARGMGEAEAPIATPDGDSEPRNRAAAIYATPAADVAAAESPRN